MTGSHGRESLMRCERCGAYMRLEERTPWNGYILHAECVPKNHADGSAS